MDRAKTMDFYRNIKQEDICDCSFCKNYISGIKENYPTLSQYLYRLGVDIEKPFETYPGEPEDGYIEY